MTQLTFNVKQFNIIKKTSFFTNYEKTFNMFNYEESSMLTKIAKTRVKMLKKVHENIIKM